MKSKFSWNSLIDIGQDLGYLERGEGWGGGVDTRLAFEYYDSKEIEIY